jgi:hypothetical protein
MHHNIKHYFLIVLAYKLSYLKTQVLPLLAYKKKTPSTITNMMSITTRLQIDRGIPKSNKKKLRIERKPQITQMKGTIKPCEIK